MRTIPAIVIGLGLVGAGAGFLLWDRGAEARPSTGLAAPAAEAPAPPAKPAWSVQAVEIAPEATFSGLMEDAGVAGADIAGIYEAAKPVYDLAAIRAGKSIELRTREGSSVFDELMYPVSTEEELFVRRDADGWTAALEPIAYEIRERTAEGEVESSLYASALAGGVDERAVIAFADVFQWTVDFAQDVRVGDRWKMVYEERWRDGRYVGPGSVLAARYVNDGQEKLAFRFVRGEDEGYYDEEGNALRKMFLKAPLSFKYITSGFTTGKRYVAAFNTSTGHRAIDYAAKSGTPIRATADGTVVSAGWSGPYGNMVSIRHNATYTTNYAHQSKMAVRRGQKVTQGQVIGYVGSTGFSTGPHLHYEMVKNGTKINPLRETFPGTDPVPEAEKPAFLEVVQAWKGRL